MFFVFFFFFFPQRGSTWNLWWVSRVMVHVALIQRVRRHPRVQSRRGGTARCQRLLFDVWRHARWTPVRGCICIRRLTVQSAYHGRGGLQGAAAAVRAVVRVRRHLTGGHVGRPGAWRHVWDVVSPSESLVAPWHCVTHQVYVVAVVTRQWARRWLEVKVLRQHGRAKPDTVHHPVHRFQSLAFPTEPAGSATKRALLEHELTARVNGPVVALARSAETFRQLDKALVQRQVVSDGVLPPLVGSSEEREAGLEELIDLTQGEPLARWALNCHHNEGDVWVGRLLGAPQAGVPLLPFGWCVLRALHHRLCAQQSCVHSAGRGAGAQRIRWIQMLLGALGRHGCARSVLDLYIFPG